MSEKAGVLIARYYLLAWLLLPNLVLLCVYNDTLPPLSSYLILLPVGLLLYFYCFPSFRWFALFNIPFAFFAGCYAAYVFEYRAIPYEGMWFSIWDMVYLEFFDLVRYYLEVFVVNLCGFLLYLFYLWKLWQSPGIGAAYRKPVLKVCFSILMCIFVGQNFLSDKIDVASFDFGNAFEQSYPLGMAYQAHTTWLESRRQEAVEYASIPMLERSVKSPPGKEIYIVVIGETARSDRWFADLEQNKYPNLESDNVVAFSDAYAQANFTDGSLHLMMTGASTYEEAENTPTLPLVSKAAGCQTIWISNNKAYRYAWQSSYAVITEQTTETPLVKRYDHAMLPTIQRAIRQSENRACLVIHLLGSHFSYHDRYSHEFMRKVVNLEDYENKNSVGHAKALLNAYDNSIHATNDLVEQIIDIVRQQSAIGLLMYTSDHGENIYDDGRQLFQHIMRTPSWYEVSVPFFIWGSDQFIHHYPEKWSNLVANRQRPVSNRQIMPTFVDLLGVEYDPGHFSSSLFADYPTDPVRYVLAPDLRLLTESDIQ
ncbi:MAG: phosphoethanolamine transferase [Gammaproteobacteria bacterium]|nr:phosphoethanolamine transferase [Gammaproteobacteria bacterium]